MKTYSLLCPTRGRASRAVELAQSALQTAKYPERLEFLFYVDENDRTLPSYYSDLASLQERLNGTMKMEIVQGPQVGVPSAMNMLADKSHADILITSNDDQIYIDRGWDIRLDKEVTKYPDQIFCIWFNDGWEAENFCTFPIVSKKWVETLGYLQFPFFEHFFTDAWIWMLAKCVNRAIYIPEILVEHRHWKTGKVAKDETYRQNETKPDDSRYIRDREVIDRFERYFLVDVELLQNSMK